MKKIYRRLLAICFGVLLACLPISGLAAPKIPDTWAEVLDIYGGPKIMPVDLPVYVTQEMTWAEVPSQDELSVFGKLTLEPYAADGSLIPEADRADRKPATGEHILAIASSRYVLIEVVILGDVLGSGQLSIAQLTRMAQALTGVKPLEGPYAEAADLNDDGSFNIADLTTLANWLTGRYPGMEGNLGERILKLF